MIINEEYFALENQAYRLANAICASKVMQTYLDAKKNLNEDATAQDKIREFKEAKAAYAGVEAYEAYAPDFQELKQAAYRAKRAMDLDETVYQFRKAERDLQLLLDSVSDKIAHAISPNILVSAGDPFFQTGEAALPAACQTHILSREVIK